MLPKRGFFLGACAAVIAGADARALLSESNSVQASVPVQDLWVCSVCKSFVTEGEEYINDPETLDQVSLEIKKLCEGEGDNAEMCEQLFEDVVDYAVGFVNDKLTPEDFCGELGFCGSELQSTESGFCCGDKFSAMVRRAVSMELAEGLSPELANPKAFDTDNPNTALDPTPSPNKPNAADCLKCKFGVSALHEAVISNDTIDALVSKADDACEKYAASMDLATTCEAAVATYTPVVVEKATEFLSDPAKVCAQIGMCPPPIAPGESESESEIEPEPERESESHRRFGKIVELASERLMMMGGNTLKGIAFLNAVRGRVVE